MQLTYSCPSWSRIEGRARWLLIDCRSLPVLTVIASPLLGRFVCFVVIFVPFRRCRVWNFGVDIWGKSSARTWDQHHLIVDCLNCLGVEYIVDCSSLSFVVAAVCSSSSMWSFLSPSFRKITKFWAQTLTFCFCLSIAIQYGTVELLTNIPGCRNRLRHKITQTMTCCSSLNSCSIVKFQLLLESCAQDLSNGVFIAIVQCQENRRWYMANQTDGMSDYASYAWCTFHFNQTTVAFVFNHWPTTII